MLYLVILDGDMGIFTTVALTMPFMPGYCMPPTYAGGAYPGGKNIVGIPMPIPVEMEEVSLLV